jgi:branched-chain amino acid transport system permease protein
MEAVGLDGKRFQLLVGVGFLLIVLFSPDGVLGLWERWRQRFLAPAAPPVRSGGVR